MSTSKFTEEFVNKNIRRKTFGILSTVSEKGWVQSTGVLYAVSNPSDGFKIYIFTDKNYKKTRNIMKNPHVSFLIPFPHYYVKFVPASTIEFQCIAKILPVTDERVMNAFKSRRILKSMTDLSAKDYEKNDLVFIELKPIKKYNCYGVGHSIISLARNPEKMSYQVDIKS